MSDAIHWDCFMGAVFGIIFAFGAGYRIGQRGVR